MVKKLRSTSYIGSILAGWLLFGLLSVATQTVASDLSVAERTNSRQLLQSGALLYQQGAFVAAKDVWLESASLSARQGDILSQALALNNIAAANQSLGEWQQSSESIAESLALLATEDNLLNEPEYWSITAKIQNTQGNWQLHAGQTALALESWQAAEQNYRQANDRPGIITASINQAKALQFLGSNVRAVKLLKQIERTIEQQPELQAANLRYLGVGLRKLGKLAQAEEILQQSIKRADNAQTANLARLELGNLYRQQSDRARSIGRQDLAQNYFDLALSSYETAAESDSLSQRARLNQLSLLVIGNRNAEAEALLTKFSLPTQLEPNRQQISALLSYARSLTCLQMSDPQGIVCPSQDAGAVKPKNVSEIVKIIKRAIAQAQAIQNPLAEAQALNQLAAVSELKGDYSQAQTLANQALLLLEGRSAPEIAYRLEWQLGRILRQQNQLTAATAAYQSAIASLEQVRQNIVFIDPQAQFSFRDRVEPVYRQYADLILTSTGDRALTQANLREAIRAINALQLAELENFLGCDLSQLIRLDETTVDPAAAQIYPIVLNDRLITIVEIANQPLIYREVKVERSQVESTVEQLQTNLSQPAKTPEALAQGQQVYKWLIEPLESVLSNNSQIETLVLLPDSLLRNIPFAALYDGEEYLIEKNYNFAISPRLKLFSPSPSGKPLKVLTGGVELAQTIEGINFPPIAQVKQELTQIAAEVETNNPLLNDAFTTANIQQELNRGDFSVIHWKTHGVFSSDPDSTFLVAYQDSIKANDLQSLVQTASQSGRKPLELLVLSACETAKGDRFAILGLAGLTVRTGARTALSSYWRADDRATTLLMTYFYRQLEAGATKAEALKQAQLYLLREEGYFAPHYWSTYVLVGNWL
ncbi:MAG: CHAT domain-containing protein [Cyanobacteria bacterium J06600_6]